MPASRDGTLCWIAWRPSNERRLRPQSVIRAISDALAPDALICLDCGANTHFAARFLTTRSGQHLVATGMLATMAPGLPFAIAAQLASQKGQVLAVVCDGGFAMLMAELSTAVLYALPVKVVVLRNDMLAEVVSRKRSLAMRAFLSAYGCAAICHRARGGKYRLRTDGEHARALCAAVRRPSVPCMQGNDDYVTISIPLWHDLNPYLVFTQAEQVAPDVHESVGTPFEALQGLSHTPRLG
jgi:thiamine pyrophosphate-dependent acetolactate synthase large subunit-like protein